MNKNYFKLFLVLVSILQFHFAKSQGADNCGLSATLLNPSPGIQISDFFSFTNTLNPTPTGTPNPTGFYYTVSADNEIFVNAATCGDLWYRVQVPASGGFNLDVIFEGGGTSDLSMALYDGCSGNLITAADDYVSTSYFLEPTVSVSCLTPGSIVYVRIWQYGCSGIDLPSDFTIIATDLADLTIGDAPSTAEVLTNTVGTTTTASFIDNNFYPLMSPDLSTNTCSNAGYAIAGGCEDRWYKVTVPANRILDVSISGATNNFTLQTFTGTACALSEYKCGSNALSPVISDIAFSTNTDVFIRIFDQDCDEYGNLDLVTTIRPKNNNDLVCNATTLSIGAAVITDTLINSTPSIGLPSGNCLGEGAYCRDQWFSVTATASATMTIKYNVTGNIGVTPNGLYVTAYSAATCNGPFVPIACKSGTTSDSLQYSQNSGEISWIRVIDFNCDTNAHQIFTIQANQKIVPPNDEVCQSIAINNNDTTIATLIGATQSATLPFPTCDYNTANVCEDVWYNYTFTEDGTFDLSITCLADCSPNNSTNIAVYTDSDADPCNVNAFTLHGSASLSV